VEKLRLVIDPAALQMVLCVLTGWLDRREREAVAYLIDENRLLRRQLGGRRLRVTDDDRRRLAVRAYRVDRAALRDIATIATPDTLLLASAVNCAEMEVRTATRSAQCPPRDPALGRTDGGGESELGIHADPRRAEERGTPSGTLDDSADPQGGRPAPGPAAPDVMANVLERTLGRIAGADFFTTEVWTWQGLVTYYTVFVIDVPPRADSRIHTASRGAVHAADRPDADDGGGGCRGRTAGVDLRSGSEMDS
jgi:hypothetical protein